MSVILGSNPNMPAQVELCKEGFNDLKIVLGLQTRETVLVWLRQSWWSEQTQKGTKDLSSKNVIKLKMILDEKTKESIKFDFYADKFVSKNIPNDYKEALKSLTKAEAAAHKSFVDVCVESLRKPQNSKYANMIKEAEKIKSLKDSGAIKVAAYITLQEYIWDAPLMEHLTNEEYLKMWI